jgi:hypothetical protein
MSSRIRILAAIALFTASVLPVAARASNVIIYGANYSDYYNITFTEIGANTAGYLMGLDCKDEWVEYKFTVPDSTVNITQIYVAATLNTSFHLKMTVTEDGTSNVQTFDFYFTGLGFG